MARRKSKARKQEEFVQAVGSLVVLLVAGGTYSVTKSVQAILIVGVFVLIIFIAVMVMINITRAERLKRSGIADIDQMTGFQFEKYLGYLFQAQGYQTKVTKASGDYGADLVLQKEGKKVVVQAKRYSKNVGIKAVQEAQASIAHYGASEAWVVTNSGYTTAAQELAQSNHVRLIARKQLIEMILAMNPEKTPSPKAVMASSPVNNMTCPRCGNGLVLRNGPKGQFYGCSSFPKCRYVKQIKVS